MTVAAIGEAMLELSPVGEDCQLAVGGDTFNTAVHLARLGVSVRYLTQLGMDSLSDRIIQTGEAEGLDMSAVLRVSDSLPGLYAIENDSSGERRFHYWRENSAARGLLVQASNRQAVSCALADCSTVYLSGITLAVIGRPARENFWSVLKALREIRVRVVFDPNYRALLWADKSEAREWYRQILPYCDWVMPTLDDEQLLWQHADAAEAAEFYQSFGAQEVIVKLPGARAIAFADNTRAERASLYGGAVKDTTGAGDAFNAGYIAARLNNEPIDDALVAGHEVAGSVLASVGAIPRRGDSVKK